MFYRSVLVVFLLAAGTASAMASGGGGAGGPPSGAIDSDVRKAEKLIKQKKWDEAISVLQKAASKDSRNADVYNWLGYAERNRGNLDAAFAAYDRALELDPKHRGAHEYVGEAYLMAGKPDKAREQLAALEKLCGTSCEEYEDLNKDIQEYDQGHKAAAKD